MDQQPQTPQQVTQPVLQPSGPVPVVAPEPWPGAMGIYKSSEQAMKQKWQVLLGLLVLEVLVAAIPALLIKGAGNAIGDLLSVPVNIALIVAYLATVRGQKPTFSSALSAGVNPMTFLRYIGNSIVIAAVLVVSFILFIVPFFIVLPRLSLATYFLIDKKMGPIEAMKASWDATKGHAGKVWGIIGLTIAFSFLAFILIGVYLFFMYAAATALLYEYISRHQAVEPVSPVPAPAPQPPVIQ